MSLPHPDVDPDGLLEYSVVFTDRSLNHMSRRFVGVMQELLAILRETYRADGAAAVPGGGSFAMEAVARQFGTDADVLVVRTGLFSHRWTQIFGAGISDRVTVCDGRPVDGSPQSAWEPAPIAEVVAQIRARRPRLVCAAHVETAAGLMLPDTYVAQLAQAVHEGGGLMVLDCIASGAMWVDMAQLGVDLLLSAPQKGWSGSPCVGYVMVSPAAREAMAGTTSSSFVCDLARWLAIADGYAEGRAAYHATMPTDTLAHNLEMMRRTLADGAPTARDRQVDLGARVRAELAARGFRSVAASGYEAPGVVVVHTDRADLQNGSAFGAAGVQVAAGVPLMCGEPATWSTFRIGLFGIDKLADIDGTVERFCRALDAALSVE